MPIFRPALLMLLALCAFVPSCTPRQIGATSQGFYGTGTSGFSVAVSPPLELAGAGSLGCPVPSDTNIRPHGSFVYGVFTDPAILNSGQEVTRHAHIVFSELPRGRWQWEMETWAKKEALSYEKSKAGGKYWTAQIFPLVAAGDWFSELYTNNGLTVPAFWLAKRWSATTDDYMRLVAEYREPAPACMTSKLESGLDARGALSILNRSVVSECEREIAEFVQRADRAINPGGLAETTAKGGPERLARQPGAFPKMDKLVGRAQHIDSDSYNYRD